MTTKTNEEFSSIPQNVIIKSALVLPEGMTEHSEELNTFAIEVQWRGPYDPTTRRGGYAVTNGGDHISRTGNSHMHNPPPRLQRHYRWETLEEALLHAQESLPTIRRNGFTWKEWQDHLASLPNPAPNPQN